MNDSKTVFHLVYGVMLILMGIGMIFKIPEKTPAILEQNSQLASAEIFVYFSLYLIAVILIGGGAKKIWTNYKKMNE